MDTKNIYIAYKISRLVFAFLLLSFFVFFPENYEDYKNVILILIVYNLTAILSLFFLLKKVSVFDFILDIVFILALLYIGYLYLSYLSILFLFPTFLYAFLTGKKVSYVLPIFIVFFYSFIVYKYHGLDTETIMNIFFILLSLVAINYAGLSLHSRFQEQNKYISLLEEEKKQNEIFKRIYRISADFAHELRNPMTSLLAAVELIDSSPHREKMIDIIKSEGKRIEDLLNTFLTFSRPVDKNFSEVNIRALCDEIIHELKEENKDKNVNISMSIDRHLYSYISKEALKLVLKNIIENAVQWARKEVVISAERKDNFIVLNVEDDGRGISIEDYEKIFEPFFTKRDKGTGLGLAIAKKYIIELGGDIKVGRSKLGGAKFAIIIPVGHEHGK
ncbi:MAG: HAMP domain-containing histidine kinase [Aquificae bacterium]|nr:HAMP domain-containing histidine kinase [Aquificota bacterium]